MLIDVHRLFPKANQLRARPNDEPRALGEGGPHTIRDALVELRVPSREAVLLQERVFIGVF